MFKDDGLYMKISDNGNISRTLIDEGKEVILPEIHVKDEIIGFSEYNFKYYAEVVDYVYELSGSIMIKTEEGYYFDLDRNNEFFTLVNNLIDMLKENDILSGLLLKWELENIKNSDSTPAIFKQWLVNSICKTISSAMDMNTMINNIFYDLSTGQKIDYKNKYPMFNNFIVPMIFHEVNGKFERWYCIRTADSYYLFLLSIFLEKEFTVCQCLCCGKYFVPKTKKKAVYCDRILKDNATCKQIGPRLKRKLEQNKDEVLKTFEVQRNKLYKRFERTEISLHTTEKSMSREEYYEWLEKATAARNAYLSGNLQKEQALDIICKDTK